MAGFRSLSVSLDDQTPDKWVKPLKEEALQAFTSKASPPVQRIFRDGSLFSPMLFGKFFDPSDAFPLWEFEAETLLARLRSSGHSEVDWFSTDKEYVLKAEIPAGIEEKIEVSVEKGKILEISGQWKQSGEWKRDWRSKEWWEHGCVRRIELPENADWKKTEATVRDGHLEMRIPRVISSS